MPADEVVHDRVIDPGRLRSLGRGGLMSATPDNAFAEVTGLAARLLEAQGAYVIFLDAGEQHVLATTGESFDAGQLKSLSQGVIRTGGIVAIDDARVTGSSVDATDDGDRAASGGVVRIGAYLGAPLCDRRGRGLGALCVATGRPRTWHDQDADVLSHLATLCETHIRHELLVAETTSRQHVAEQLAEFGSQLAAANTRDDIVIATRGVGREVFGADTAVLAEVVGATIELVSGVGVEGDMIRRFRRIDPDSSNPFADAIRDRRVTVFESRADFDRSYPQFATETAAGNHHAYAVVPLLDADVDVVHGAVAMMWVEARSFVSWERELLGEMGRLSGRGFGRIRTAENSQMLSEIAAQLSAAASVTDVAAMIGNRGKDLLNALTGQVGLVDGDHLRQLTSQWMSSVENAHLELLALSEDLPACEAVRTGATVVLTGDADWARFPAALRTRRATGAVALVCAPFAVGAAAGVVAFSFSDSVRVADREVRLAGRLAEMAGRSLDRAQLLDASRDTQLRLRGVLDGLFVNVTIVDRAGAIIDANRTGLELIGLTIDDVRHQPFSDLAIFDDATSTRFRSEIEKAAESGERRRFDAAASIDGSVIPFDFQIAPIMDDGAVTSMVLSSLDISDRLRFEDQQHQLLARQRVVTEQLQRSLLPAALPDIDEIDIAAVYRPAEDDVDVGGDWYDSFLLDDGRLVIAIGDVVGSGIDVAGATGQLRSATRALADVSTGPADLVVRVEQFASRVPAAFMSTMLYVELDRQTGTCVFCRAGHIPPLIVERRTGCTKLIVDAGSPPIGVSDGEPRTVGRFRLEVGDVLLMATDGLMERPSESIDAGLERFADAARSHAGHPTVDAVVDGVVDELVGSSPNRDDLCIIGIRRESE